MSSANGPGVIGFRISATGSAGLDWQKLEATWAQAGEEHVFSAGWLSDHLSDASRERGGPAFEAFTTAAALAHRVPGKWIGLAVAANTFRHPSVLAKQATMLDILTSGRFILDLGTGWHAASTRRSASSCRSRASVSTALMPRCVCFVPCSATRHGGRLA